MTSIKKIMISVMCSAIVVFLAGATAKVYNTNNTDIDPKELADMRINGFNVMVTHINKYNDKIKLDLVMTHTNGGEVKTVLVDSVARGTVVTNIETNIISF